MTDRNYLTIFGVLVLMLLVISFIDTDGLTGFAVQEEVLDAKVDLEVEEDFWVLANRKHYYNYVFGNDKLNL